MRFGAYYKEYIDQAREEERKKGEELLHGRCSLFFWF